jgi:beta-lactamase class A
MIQEIALMAVLQGTVAVSPSPVEKRIAERLDTFQGVLGVAAVHLDTGETVAVRADTRFPTASLIKTAVMVEVFQQIADGRVRPEQTLPLTDGIKVGGSGVLQHMKAPSVHPVSDLLYLMIALSDNTATNMLVGLVSTKAVDDRMVALGLPQTRLYRPTFRGGHPDVFPEEEKEYGLGSSTPRESARLLELIARGKVVSPAASEEMVALLGKQQFHEMIPRLLPGEGVTVAHKTGQDEEKLADVSGLRGSIRTDAGIVATPKGRYVIAIFTRRVKDDRWTVDNAAYLAGAEVSRLVFDHFTRN